MTMMNIMANRSFAFLLALSLVLMMPVTAFAQPDGGGASGASAAVNGSGEGNGGLGGGAAGGGEGEGGFGGGAGSGVSGSEGLPGADAAGSLEDDPNNQAALPQLALVPAGDGEGGVLVGNGADEVTIHGTTTCYAPDPVNLEVYIGGVPIGDTTGYGFEWYSLVSAVGESSKWVDFAAPNMERQTGSRIDIPATVESQIGSLDLYCQVTDPDGIVLNPITKEGDSDSISDPMKRIDLILDKTSVVFADKNGGGSIGLHPGETKQGVSLSADGKTITLDNFQVVASNANDPWLIAGLSVEIPNDPRYQDITIQSIGSNSLTCVLRGGVGDPNDGWGIYVEAMGTHTITLIGDELSATGGFQGFYAGGNNGEGAVEYLFDGGLSLALENAQTGPVEFPGALILSRSGATFKDVQATLKTNSPICINSLHREEDLAKDITLKQGADVKVALTGEGFKPAFGILGQGILVDNGDLIIEGGKLSVDMSDISLQGITGIGAGNLSISQGGSLNVSIDQSRKEETGGQTGIKLGGNLAVDASTVVVDCVGHDAGLGVSTRCIVSNGTEHSILNGSNVAVSSQAAGPASGITFPTDAGETSMLTVENSTVSVQAISKQDAVGIAAYMLSFTEDAAHTVKAHAVGGTSSCAIIAAEVESSHDPKRYTPGYKPVRWSFGANTAILTPVSGEINLFSFEEANTVGYTVGESVYAPGATDKAVQEVVIGYKKGTPIPPTGDPLATFPSGAVVLAVLTGLTLAMAAFAVASRWRTAGKE